MEGESSVCFRLTIGSRNSEIVILPGSPPSLSVRKIFDMLGYSFRLPVISNLTTSLGIYEASASWIKDCLDSVSLVLLVEDWIVVKDKFVIHDLSFDICTSNIFTRPRHLSMSALALIKICEINLDVVLEIMHSEKSSSVTFNIATIGHPLCLKSILDHFSSGEVTLPSNLKDVSSQTEIDAITVQGLRNNNGWVLSNFALSMSIQKQLFIVGS